MTCVRRNALTGLALFALTSGLACSEHEFVTCDITQHACQEDVYYRVLKLRGDGYDPFGGLPPVTVVTEDDYRRQLEAEAASAAQGPKDPWDKALDLLHFTSAPTIPNDAGTATDGGAGSDAGSTTSTIDDEVAHIYAFYDPKNKTITVISHPSQTGSHVREEAMITLAHELVHALQDREFNLNESDLQSSDAYFAWDSIVEGDARFYENLFTNDIRKMLGLSALDALKLPDDELDWDYVNFDQLGSPLFAARALMYPLGAKYEATAFRSGGNAAVRHAYAKAPRRTVGFLVGHDGKVPPVPAAEFCDAFVVRDLLPTDPADKTIGGDHFGALLLYTFLRGWNVSHDLAFTTAQTWTGDSLVVQADHTFTTGAAAWLIAFSTPPPSAIVQALTATGELTVAANAGTLLITVADSPVPPTWTRSSICQ